jgi:hypothetical protein
MATTATYRATAQAVAFASAKSMIAIYNADGTFVLLKAFRLWQFNNGTGAVTGVLCTMKVNRITTSLASGTTITAVLHDTNSTALGAHVTLQTNGTVGARTDLFRQWIWSNDEPAVSGASMDEWELLVPFATVFDSGYGDSNVEPITCRNGQGVEIQQSSASAVGTNDFEIEFTAA